jgi:NDP-sugar pyrophosphorylase family protein
VELGNFSAIDYTISWLVENDIEEVFLFYSHSKQQVEEYYQSVNKVIDIKLHLNYMKPTEFKRYLSIHSASEMSSERFTSETSFPKIF